MGFLDDAVLDAARAGAGWAFERIHGELAGPVLGYLRQQGVADPDGTTNEAFHRAFARVASFDGGVEAFRRFVFTVAHNLVIDERRFAARRQDVRPVEAVPDVAGGDAEADAFDRLGNDQVRRMLALVSADQRDVLLLRFVADLSLEEVAEATGRTVTAVKALQKRGLDALRRALDPLGVSTRAREISPEAVSREPDPTFTGV
ncbi:MAG TPA: RNA polymerase sigma factor [Acidimicrobiales bacterium]|nr:RNA polymerase sigma factor [Acidimicrobiales bacterium]